MKSIFTIIILALGLASLTAATNAREMHSHHDPFTFFHHDEGDELKPHHFTLELDCRPTLVSVDSDGTSQLKLSCTIESTRRVPDGTHDPSEFRINFQSRSGVEFRNGKMVRPTLLRTFNHFQHPTYSRSYIPAGKKRVELSVGCVKTHLGWNERVEAQSEIWCDVLEVGKTHEN